MRFALPTRSTTTGRTLIDFPVGRLESHFQPQVRLSDGALVGAELLVRWRHPSEGLVLPSAFLAFVGDAEHRELLRLVIADAVEVLAGDADLIPSVSVNAEPMSLEPSLVRYVVGVLQDAGVDPGRLKIELTEGSPGASTDVTDCITELARVGVQVSMDDFGTGYSSMHRLQHVVADEVKVDRRLFQAAAVNDRAATIVRSIADLGTALGAVTVAEGVATAEQALLARQLGFTVGQGFLWSVALPVEDLRRWAGEHALAAVS